MKFHKAIAAFFLAATLAGCVASAKRPEMTSLQIQAIQLKEYDSTKEIVFPSVISVFQDIGYIISNADLETGIITAESAAENNPAMAIFLGVSVVKQTKVTAFVEQIGSTTRVRLNFVEIEKSSSGYGQNDRKDMPILDTKIYQNAFNKIGDAIFIRSS
jgi:hypothetical protein